MKKPISNNHQQVSDYFIFLPVPVVYLILLPFVEFSGKAGVSIICVGTLVLLGLRYLNKNLYYSKSRPMTVVTISYSLLLFLGNVLVFESLFDSTLIAISVSMAVLVASILALASKGFGKLLS